MLRHLFSHPYVHVCTIVITHAIYSINIVYTNTFVWQTYIILQWHDLRTDTATGGKINFSVI